MCNFANMTSHRKSIILLIVIASVLMTLVIFKFAILAFFMYGFATFACVVTMQQKKKHLDFWGFLKEYGWFYWVASASLVLCAVVNYNGDKAAEKEYYRCYEAVMKDTVVSIGYWRKTGNVIDLSNGKSYRVYIYPYIGEIENIVRKKRNIIIAHKEAYNDTINFEDLHGYEWNFVISNPQPKTIFDN